MRPNLTIFSILPVLVTALFSSPWPCAASGFQQDAAITQRPNAAAGPTEVQATIVVIDIPQINNARQMFLANVFTGFRWNDPRLRHDGQSPVRYALEDIWHPQMRILNRGAERLDTEITLSVSADGTVDLVQRYIGTFSNPLDLKNFPLDTQVLMIEMVSVSYDTTEVVLVKDRSRKSKSSPQFSLPDWDVGSWEVVLDGYRVSGGTEFSPRVSFQIEVKRKFGYFLFKIIFPLILIVGMSWAVFWIDPAEASSQISVSTTTMLTLIAYRFAIGASLPRVSYLTRLDLFIFGSTIIVFLTLAQAVYTSKKARAGHGEYALKVDRWCRILFPTSFVLIALYSFLGPV